MSGLENFGVIDWEYCFEYLDDLRASGETNMFGARPFLADEFALGNKDAAKVLSAWMKTFGEGSAAQRARMAFDEFVP